MNLPEPSLTKNDKLAKRLIWTVSIVVFAVVVLLHELKLEVDLGFDVHIFAKINAIINGMVATLLLLGIYFVKSKRYILHKKTMNLAILLSLLFLLSYIAHHILADSTSFGKDGPIRYVYYTILISHIILAGISLPFILFTAYRASISEFPAHKKMAKYVFPIWLYVAVTGVIVYLMISPYY